MTTVPNGLAGLAERLVRVLERLADPRVLVTAMVVAGGYFYWAQFRVHDLKLEALLTWTTQKTAFDFLACAERATTDLRLDLCDKARAGQPIDMKDWREAGRLRRGP